MMKKIAALLLVLMFAFTAFACDGAGSKTIDIALVTDVGNIDDKSFNEGSWKGVEKFAQDNNVSHDYFRPSEDTTAARVETIKSAIDKGAKVVVCPGYLFEDAIYEVQTEYPDTMFLLIDGEPHTPDYTTYKTEKNVHCILFQEEQAGYFAGYAAVKDGYKQLGFLGGGDVPAVKRFGYGFIIGADAAAKELGITDEVSVKHWFSGAFVANDDIRTKMAGWYTEGTEVIFSCGGGIYQSATAAAEAAGKKVIGVDVDQAAESETIITSAMKNLTNSVILSLTALYENDWTWPEEYAGITAKLGVKEDCVGLPTEDASWRLENYTVAEYEALYAKVKSGEIVVSDSIEPPSVSISVDYQG